MTVEAESFSDKRAGIYGLVCLAAVGGTLLWATFAPLAEGVTAPGTVTVDNNRKKVQHLEGGIIREISVHEGSAVKEGDVLFRLDDISARAQRDQLAQDCAVLVLSQARLEAFTAGRTTMPDVDLSALKLDPTVEAGIRRQQSDQLTRQSRWLGAEDAYVSARQSTMATSSLSKAEQITALEAALASSREELALNERLLSIRMARLDRVQQLRRQVASQEAELSRLRSDSTLEGLQASNMDQEKARNQAQALRDAASELTRVRTDLLATRERLANAEDILARKVIIAPRSGVVLNLAFTTIGGVVQPGEPLLEIVPADTPLIATVRLAPNHRNDVYEGQDVKAQISAFQSWKAPRIPGKVVGVSADLKHDQQSGAVYYEARIELDQSELKKDQLSVLPGMPVEAFITSGRTRTPLDYFLEPLMAVIRRGAVAQ